MPLVAFKKKYPRMFIFSNFTMFVKQILNDWYLKTSINFKNGNCSYFLSYSPVREFIASKVRLSSLFGYSHCSKSLKTIADHYVSLESAISDSKRKLNLTHRTWKKREKSLPVDSFPHELLFVIGHVSFPTAFSSFLLIFCSCFGTFLFTQYELIITSWTDW